MIDAVHELIDDLSATPQQLRDLFEEKPTPENGTNDEWGPIEIVAHMADFERIYRGRITEVLSKQVPYLKTFDEAAAAHENDYASKSVDEVLDTFADQRSDTILLLVNLALKDWERTGVHDEMGEVSVEDLAGELCQHDSDYMKRLTDTMGQS